MGARDDFFTLGGDSILSIQIVSRARRPDSPSPPRTSSVTARSPNSSCAQGKPHPARGDGWRRTDRGAAHAHPALVPRRPPPR
ncbi:hypothetical protein [Streptomyces alboflavus]|uniref:hypothetical protein n=1 Tax=Streptomyces alboflavus TaxID=67267 RepID=UPI001F3A1604|nr:hypothetical protein [Streptomyces alboflavus]